MNLEKKLSLITWYKKNGRHELPWRNTKNAYFIYLSEIMLQQTQVKTVLERFYFPFLEKFPTFKSVANATEDEVLKMWEGLGYYTRARNIYKTAQTTQGILPKSAKELTTLCGIGVSTANAIACFAFGEAVPILDANVKRILYRYYALKAANEKQLWQYAYELFNENSKNKKYAYEYNQALMDIGSLICTRTNPKCEECPLFKRCQGKENSQEYPTKKIKKAKEQRYRNILIYRHNNCFALFQNEEKLLKGLYGFKQLKTDEEIEEKAMFLGEIKHEYSHISLKAKVYVCEVLEKQFEKWFTLKEINALAMSKVDHKAFSLLENKKLLIRN
ncbi:MAG: A/G-specific adenine glycosylase [Arcobacteraceae bacterium]